MGWTSNHWVEKVGTIANQSAVQLDRWARHFNVYRVGSYTMSQFSSEGLTFLASARMANDRLDKFSIHDQDLLRDDLTRRMDLARCSMDAAEQANELLAYAHKVPINNLSLLHEICKSKQAIFGDKNVNECFAYARRASRKIHPDKCSDLSGWDIPGTAYWKDLPRGYKYEHAKHGAAALFLLHNQLKVILSDRHYQSLLYSTPVQLGGSLTILQALSDSILATTIGSLLCIQHAKVRSAVLSCGGALAALLLCAHLFQFTAKWVESRKAVSCRAVVLYTPSPFTS